MSEYWSNLNPTTQQVLLTVLKVMVTFHVLLGLFSVMTYIERRMLAFMQFRLGPNRTGPFGLLQPVADGIKLFFKEEFMPEGANRLLFVAAPAVAVITAFLSIAVVPYGNRDFQIAPALDVGVLYIFAITSLGVYGVVMAGWASNNKYTLMGGLRSSAQMFSYELSLGMSWIGVILLAQSFQISDIVDSQNRGWGLLGWNWLVQFPAFIVYVIAATAEVNRTPFDLPEAETELVAGFHTEYSSMKFALLQMAEYVNMITVAAVGANMFLGGWLSPIPGLPDGFLWFFAKMGLVLFYFIWLRGTLPRFRYDQLMHFGWKILVPAAALNALVTAGVVAAIS